LFVHKIPNGSQYLGPRINCALLNRWPDFYTPQGLELNSAFGGVLDFANSRLNPEPERLAAEYGYEKLKARPKLHQSSMSPFLPLGIRSCLSANLQPAPPSKMTGSTQFFYTPKMCPFGQ
jgi:hypothetical protein